MTHKFQLLCMIISFIAVLPASGSEKITIVADDSGAVKLLAPFGVGADSAGDMFIVQYEGNRIARLDARGALTAFAGTGEKGYGGDGGPAAQAKFNNPHHLLVTPDGDIYVADTLNCRVRKIDARTGVITTFAGTGKKGFDGDGGPATDAQFGDIYCLALTANAERMYLADLDNRRIRAIDMKTGIVTTVAGNGKTGVPADGAAAIESPLVDPRAVTVDSKGNLYILERSGNALRVVDSSGKIRTVAGTGRAGASGDGPALQAMLNGPKHLCVDLDDNVLIADSENHIIRKYFPRDSTMIRLAGTGTAGAAGAGGASLECQLNRPHGVYVDRNGKIYIADSINNRVLKLQ